MKKRVLPRFLDHFAAIFLTFWFGAAAGGAANSLDRGIIALHQPDGKVFVSWRLLASDRSDVGFNIYRAHQAITPSDWGEYASRGASQNEPLKLNTEPITEATCFVDPFPGLSHGTSYFVRPVIDGKELADGQSIEALVTPEPKLYHAIPLQTPEGYAPNDASIGDLDGDGALEIVLKQEGRSHDNSHRGTTDPVKLQAYELDGTLLWKLTWASIFALALTTPSLSSQISTTTDRQN